MDFRKITLVLAIICAIGIASTYKTNVAYAENTTTTTSVNQYSGYSIEELLKLIDQLQARIKELRKQKDCTISDTTLSLGDGDTETSKKDVKRLQEFLKTKGFFNAQTTGFFGKITRSALVAYQASIGVPQTGEFDSATRAKTGCVVSDTSTTTTGNSNTTTNNVKSINLTVTGKTATWTVDGTSPSGFKLVFSRNPNPEYPTRNGDEYEYYSDSSTRSGTIRKVDGQTGTYYVRVCEYVGGKCGVYSNQVTTQVSE